MLSRARRHASYANITATLALVFAMSGGALAATHYLITSTKQIKPSVLKQLKGARGPVGPTGPKGETGATGLAGPAGPKGETGAGLEGKEGKEGKSGFTETLPPGKTEHGTWSFNGPGRAEGRQYVAVSFPVPLKKGLAKADTVFVEEGQTGTGGCEGGREDHPLAKPGFLCVYTEGLELTEHGKFAGFLDPEGTGSEGAGPGGALLEFESLGAEAWGHGSWVVTAPEEP